MVKGPPTTSEISPAGRFADELRLGASGNRWLQAWCTVGTGEAGHRRLQPLDRHGHDKRRCKKWRRQRNNAAGLARRTRLALGHIRAGGLPRARMVNAVMRSAGYCTFRRIPMGVRLCRHCMMVAGTGNHCTLLKQSRHRHLGRHCIAQQATQWQQEDHESNKQATHRADDNCRNISFKSQWVIYTAG